MQKSRGTEVLEDPSSLVFGVSSGVARCLSQRVGPGDGPRVSTWESLLS